MIIFLYGQDTYRSREEMRRIVEENKSANPNWLDFIRIDVSDKEIEIFKELRQTADTVSMFGQKKLMIIENIFSSNQEIQKEILEFLKKRKIEDDKDITIIFWTEETDSKNAIFKYLQSKAKSKEFKPLEKLQLRNWVKDYISEQKGETESQALDKLIEYVGNDLWRMKNEINKLISFKSQTPSTKSQTIKVKDVELLVGPKIDLNIFDMVDAIGYKNKAKAIMLFNQHIEKGADEHYLLSMFVYQFRNLLKIKSLIQINTNTKDTRIFTNNLGMHPFVFKKTSQQANSFTFEDLKKIYHQLMTIDFESKLGKTDIQTALESFIVKI